jgi:hypothetical protein
MLFAYILLYSAVFYNPIGATLVTQSEQCAKTTAILHIMSHGTPTSTPAEDSTSHAMDMILCALEQTPTCH